MKTIIFIFCLLLVKLFSSENRSTAPKAFKIVEGRDAKVDEFPFIVRLQVQQRGKSEQWCGGAIIDEKWIITAAHCVHPVRRRRARKYSYFDRYTVFIGAHGWNDGLNFKVRPRHIESHRDYDDYMKTDDIALIEIPEKFARRFKFEGDDIAHINTKSISSWKDKLLVAGWGVQDSNKYGFLPQENTPEVLQVVELKSVDYTECQKIKRMENKKDSVFCTLTTNGSDSCQGDSGGPVFKKENSKWTIYGLVNFGSGCGTQEGQPSVNANVQFYIKWIEDIATPFQNS